MPVATAENILNETTLTLAQASRQLPGKPSITSVWRWCREGYQGVHLEHVRLGRKIITSREAVGRFSQRLAEADRYVPATAGRPYRGNMAQQRAERAEHEADAEGL